MTELLNYLVQGVSIGATYALLALPMSLVISTTGVLDLPIGAYGVIGGLTVATVGLPWGLLLGLLAAVAAALVMALLHQIAARQGRDDPLTVAVLGLGLVLALQSIAQALFGVDPLRLKALTGVFRIGGVTISHTDVAALAVVTVILAALLTVLYRTPLGREMRAVSINASAARLVGIPVRRLQFGIFVCSGVLAYGAGVFYTISPGAGFGDGLPLSLLAFSAVVVLGARGPASAVAGSLFIGVIEALAIGYTPAQIGSVVPLVVVLLVLASGKVSVGRVSRA